MKKTHLLVRFCIFCFGFNLLFAQEKLDNYNSILIPKQFSFQKTPNEYNINELLKVSFNKYNFKSFIKGDTIATDIKPCEILNINIHKSGILTTNLKIDFSDCYGKTIYTTLKGVGRNKDFKLGFYEALRNTLKDTNIQNHKFTPSSKKILATTKNNTKAYKHLNLTLNNKTYKFVKTATFKYNIYINNQFLGVAKKEDNTNVFMIDAKYLSGTGTFDNFGNFMIVRTNPLNQQSIKDTMLRVF